MADPWAVQSVEKVDPWSVTKVTPARQRTAGEQVTGAVANLQRGTGIADEMAAATGVLTGLVTGRHRLGMDRPGNVVANNLDVLGQAYQNELALRRQAETDFTAEHPNVAALSRGAGSAATVVVPGAKVAQGTNLLGNVARNTVAAAGTGALYAAADAGTPGERIEAAREAALNPVNVLFGAVAGRVATPAKGKPGKAPTLDELQTQRKAAYKAVDESGHSYSAEGFGSMVAGIKAELGKARFDPDFHPVVQTMVAKLDAKVKQGYAPTLSEIDDLRKLVSENVAGANDRNIRRLGGVIMRGIDTFVDAGAGGQVVRAARDLYKREAKVAAVTQAQEKARQKTGATYSGGNIDNATRQQMAKVLDKTANLTDDERAALEGIIQGGKGQNALRQVGKFSPQGNGLSQWFNLGAVAAAGPGGLAVPIVGAIAKSRADAITQRKVRELVDLMAAGGTKEQLAALTARAAEIEGPAGSALRKLIAAKAARIGGVTSATASPAR